MEFQPQHLAISTEIKGVIRKLFIKARSELKLHVKADSHEAQDQANAANAKILDTSSKVAMASLERLCSGRGPSKSMCVAFTLQDWLEGQMYVCPYALVKCRDLPNPPNEARIFGYTWSNCPGRWEVHWNTGGSTNVHVLELLSLACAARAEQWSHTGWSKFNALRWCGMITEFLDGSMDVELWQRQFNLQWEPEPALPEKVDIHGHGC